MSAGAALAHDAPRAPGPAAGLLQPAALLVPRPVDALAFGVLGCDRAACLEGGPTLALARARLGYRWTSIEEAEGGRRRRWSSSDLGRLTAFADVADGSLAPVVAYATAAHPQLDARLLGPSPRLAQWLADKVAFRRLATTLGLRVPHYVVLDAPPRHESLARRLDLPYVLQLPRGSAGVGTFVVHDASDVARAVRRHPRDATWLASAFHDGPVLNAHVIVADGVARLLPLSVQLTGGSGLAPEPAAYCGSDFGATRRIPAQTRAALAAELGRLGRALGELGWRGVMGVDAIVEGDGARLLEVNPRMQASSWLLAELQRRAGADVVGDLHLAAVRGDELAPQDALKLEGATMVVRAPAPCSAPSLRPGVHRLDGRRLRFVRAELGVAGLAPEELLLDGMPAADAPVDRGAVLVRVSAARGFVAADGRSLNRYARAVFDGLG